MLSYEDIVENLAEGVVGVDLEMKVTVFNQSAEKMTGTSRTLVIGRPAREVFGKDVRIVEMLEKTLGEGRLFAEYEEKLHRRLSSEALPVGITTSQVFDAEGRVSGAVGLIKDLSGIKSLEAGELRKERLVYIGTFAANLAHEIKNPLSGIRGVAQLLTKKVKDASLDEYTRVIIKEADRLNLIVNEMLDFARPAKLNPRELNIHMVLDSVILLLQEGAAPGTFVKDYDPSLPAVRGDENRLTQVFLNLVKNAKEALGAGGRVQVNTRMMTDFHLGGHGGGQMAVVEIKDNGRGIEEGDLEKIFTPFFTTKQKGSGLGMAISLKIIEEHGGLLKIDSAPGAGTTVAVFLPVAGKEKRQ
ncbi:MAG: ATP-binding protein [Deltaproteobacteria bacterium]|nr:ATP-binding protein [Deltaproteobacteria bacterium]